MQARGGYSNQDSGAVDTVVPEVVASLSAEGLRTALGDLATKLAQLRASDAQPQAIVSPRKRPRRPGWVLDAVVRVLSDRAAPMRVVQAQEAVEEVIEEQVSANSVSWVLSSHSTGPSPLFVRVARGRYVLASETVATGAGASLRACAHRPDLRPLDAARARQGAAARLRPPRCRVGSA